MNKSIIKFEEVSDQSSENIRRISGFIKAKYILGIIDSTDLQANPRSSKAGPITNAIIDSIKISKDIFHYKTKGILLSVSTPPEELDRKRYRIEFKNSGTDGILDGGHNTFAIAIYILGLVMDDEKKIRNIKKWSDLKPVWKEYRDDISGIQDDLDLLIPIEILTPSNDTEETYEYFSSSISEICSARNNNVQLPIDTKANQVGHYEEIKEILDPIISENVEWKTNESGYIKVQSILALSWLPLSLIELPKGISAIKPNVLYSSKATCVKAFTELMVHESISELVNGKYNLTSSKIRGALELLKDLPRLYDEIYEQLPSAYNKNSGKFGRISCVKCFNPDKYGVDPKKNLKKKPLTPFYRHETEFDHPQGFMFPIFSGLTSLMEEKDGKVGWKTNPSEFIKENLVTIVGKYKGVLEALNYDPQKVGKSILSYNTIKDSFDLLLHK